MNMVVANTTALGKPYCGLFYHAQRAASETLCLMAQKSKHRPTFLRQWRQHRGYSLDKLADRVPMDKSNLSKVERGILPYNQDLLERLADALMTDPASLLMRNPANPAAIWSIWDQASPGERAQIESVAAALISAKKQA